MKKYILSLLMCAIILGIFVFNKYNTSQQSQMLPARRTDFVLNTICTVTLYDGENLEDPMGIIGEGFQLCREYENIFSTTIEGSEIYNINNSKGETIQVSDDVKNILETSLNYSKITNGAFDVAIYPVSKLWQFGVENPVPPADEDIQENLQYVGYDMIEIDGNNVTLKNENAGIDLGAIAKGYIADKMKEFFVEKGVTNATINLGGNIITIGGVSEEEDFTIGVQKPFGETNEVLGVLKINGRAVTTSGIYERCFEYNGQFYHHILDPNTGYPVENDLAAVTIISDKSIDGDALSTSCFLLGEEKALELINSIENTDAIFVKKDGELIYSDGIGSDVIFEVN